MSETTNLKLFKHDDPPNNTDQFDVEKALNDNWDKIERFAEKVNNKVIEIEEIIDTLIVTKTITLNEDVAEQAEYELPISYTVGNDSLKIHWQGVLLEQGEDGNYIEIGEPGQASNKVKFGWNLEAGETLIIEVRGDTNE